MECFPPTFTTHSLGSYWEPNSRVCHAQMASRRGMMPPVGVYLVKFCSMARMAAFLMWSGVGKSGSPGPKSAISTPLALSLSASAITAEVGEICMRLMRSVSCTRSPSQCAACCRHVPANSLGLRNFRPQALFNDGRDQTGQRTAEARDFTNQSSAQITVRLSRQHENGFESRLQLAVHQSHLQFVLIIGDGANTAQNHAGATLPRIVHQQSIKYVDFHTAPGAGDLAKHLDAFRNGKQRSLVGVAQHADYERGEHLFAALGKVKVAVGHRVKRARIDGYGRFHSGRAVLVF